MDEADKHCFKTPPTMANPRQGGYEKSNNIPTPSKSPSPSTSGKAATPPKRIISQIPLDFNKLKQSGLHIKLAEALSIKNVNAARGNDASATTTTNTLRTNYAYTSAAALPAATSTATHIQQQQQQQLIQQHQLQQQQQLSQRQPAPMPVRNTNEMNSLTAEEQSQQSQRIKALIKHKILNKDKNSALRQQATATATTSTAPSPVSSGVAAGHSGGFTVPIAKADVTVRSKPPLLLNLLNQLPKQRATCGSSRTQTRRQQEPPPAKLPAPLYTPPAPLPVPPLIVLEHKVLAPEEKIDLRALRLPNGQPAAVPPTRNIISVDKMKVLPKKITEMPKTGKKIILNANKLKMPREQLAQLAKEVCNQAMQHKQQQSNPNIPVPALNPICRSIERTPIVETSTNPAIASTRNPVAAIAPSIDIHTSLITPSVATSTNPKPTASASAIISENPSTSAEVKTKPTNKALSAVDFIAQLTAINPTNYIELSAEEMSMNARFGCPKAPVPLPKSNKMEEELPIGKILQMQDMDILHATLNVNGNEPNVLSISPNAIKLKSSEPVPNTESPPVVNTPDHDIISLSSTRFEPMKVTAPRHVYTNNKRKSILSKTTPVVLLTEPTEVAKKDETPEIPAINVPSNNVNPPCDKEESQPAKQVPFRPKKAKINLVQRNKRLSITKTTETIVATETKELLQEPDNQISPETNESADTDENAQKQVITESSNEEHFTKPSATVNAENNNSINKDSEDLVTTMNSELNLENVDETTADEVINTKNIEPVIAEETAEVNQSTKERDLTQLYHPPKLPKHKQKILNKMANNNEVVSKEHITESAPPALTLLDVLTQEPPPPQGEAQLPFRSSESEAKQSNSIEAKPAEPLGIQNLLTHLAAENVVPASKEFKATETVKAPRKKLVKTRPVLNAKRTTKAPEPQAEAAVAKPVDALHPRKRALLADSKTNGTHRVLTSSTSDDDDAGLFYGFENESPIIKQNKHFKSNETDISDDATPDYDETEEEPLPNKVFPARKPKTESAVENKQNETSLKQVEVAAVNQAQVEPTELVSTVVEDTLQECTPEKNSTTPPATPEKSEEADSSSTREVAAEIEKDSGSIVIADTPGKRSSRKNTQKQESELTDKRKRPRHSKDNGQIEKMESESAIMESPAQANTNPRTETVETEGASNPVQSENIGSQKKKLKKNNQSQEIDLQDKRKRPRLSNRNKKGEKNETEHENDVECNPTKHKAEIEEGINAVKTESIATSALSKKRTCKKNYNNNASELAVNPKRPRHSSVKEKDATDESTPMEIEKTENPPAQSVETNEVLNAVEPVIVKKRLGRPRKSEVVIAAPVNTSTSSRLSDASNTTSDIETPRKRGRKGGKVNSIATPTPDETTPKAPPKAPKRRGPKCNPIKLVDTENQDADSTPVVSDFDSRLLLIRKREQLNSGEELRQDGHGKGAKQCGLCLVRLDKADWQLHLGEHYGVGWLIGEPQPVITRQSVIKMMKTYISAGSKRLKCRLCDRYLTSALGMLLHLEGCGSNERIVCESCKGSYTKLSYPTHFRSCPKRAKPSETNPETEKASGNEASTPVYSNSGRVKRKSTLNAETKLERFAANMKKESHDDSVTGKDFDGEESDYDMGADKESSEEDETEGVDSNEDEDCPASTNRSLAKSSHIPSKNRISQKPLFGRSNVEKVAGDRWKFFTDENYAKSVLYPHLLPRYEKMLPDDATNILPSKESTSMRYGYDKVDGNDWKQLAPFEGFSMKNEHICFLGNAIKELAWVPLPPTVDTQYLLCSQRKTMHSFVRQCKDKQEDALLLLLECTVSPTDDNNIPNLQARLHYGISVPLDPVHSFAFMPSGGYDESTNRLGLLAVGSSSRAVIYALPLHLPRKETRKESPTEVIILEAVITLSLDIENPVRDPCTKISWSESSGHNLLVSGYSSGYVAFFDIGDEQGLNCLERNNQRHFLPSTYFYFGERNISYLELHYDTNGARWLAVGANVRKLFIYDISNWSQPLSLMGDTISNLYLGGVSWPPLWESLVVGATELNKCHCARTITVNPSGINFDHSTLDALLSSPRAVHFNWEQVTMVTVADNGDVVFLQSNQLNMESVLHKRITNCRTVSSTKACYLGGATEPNSIGPNEFLRDYGLLLQPLKNMPNAKKSDYLNYNRQPKYDLLSHMRLNCARWNWNRRGLNWVAVGAEHGLLRFFHFDRKKYFAKN